MKVCGLLALFALAIFASADDLTCAPDNCDPAAGCVCLSDKSPLTVEETPQFVVLTFDDAITVSTYNDYYMNVLYQTANPDGSSIGATFFVPHKYTNYSVVHELYMSGFEIAVNSVTRTAEASYWAKADEETLIKEFGGQREIISTFANIPKEHIRGARTPNLELNGDTSFSAYVKSELFYDNSWPTPSNSHLYPYTLDYKSMQSCLVAGCPEEAYPGFFVSPVINMKGYEDAECNSITGCAIEGTVEEIFNWLVAQFEKVYSTSKAPQTLMLSAGWFMHENTTDAFIQYLEYLQGKPDVFLVDHEDVQNWMMHPVPVSEYARPSKDRDAACESITCELVHAGNEHIWMGSCIPCPDIYPWLDNPSGMLDEEGEGEE